MMKKGLPQTPMAKGIINEQDLAQRFKLWFIVMRTGIHTGEDQGLPQAVAAPLVHSSSYKANSWLNRQIDMYIYTYTP